MKEPRRIQITHIHPGDAYHGKRDKYIGLKGTFELRNSTKPGYYSGHFYPDNQDIAGRFFHAIRYRKT